jgi:uncharacterized protein YggE
VVDGSRSGPAIVTVAGTGRASRAADIAEATFVVESLRPTAAEARASAALIAAAVLDAVRGAGVADADLHTAGLDLSPTWEHDGSRMVRTGFSVTNRIAATVRDLDGVGRVLDAGLGAGATGLDGVRFRLADEATASEEARRNAVADARLRATTIAAALGGRLGRLAAVSEGAPVGPAPMREARMSFAAAAADAPTPVLPGAVEVAVTVSAAWELETGAG